MNLYSGEIIDKSHGFMEFLIIAIQKPWREDFSELDHLQIVSFFVLSLSPCFIKHAA